MSTTGDSDGDEDERSCDGDQIGKIGIPSATLRTTGCSLVDSELLALRFPIGEPIHRLARFGFQITAVTKGQIGPALGLPKMNLLSPPSQRRKSIR